MDLGNRPSVSTEKAVFSGYLGSLFNSCNKIWPLGLAVDFPLVHLFVVTIPEVE